MGICLQNLWCMPTKYFENGLSLLNVIQLLYKTYTLWTAFEEQNLSSVGFNTLAVTQENIWVIGLLQGKGVKGSLRKEKNILLSKEKNKSQLLLSLISYERWHQAGIRSISDINSECYWTRRIFPLFSMDIFFRSFITVKVNVETLTISFIQCTRNIYKEKN